ncbi:MAG: hypothetical protein ACYC27_22800 [Armatimonadota bacterium]
MNRIIRPACTLIAAITIFLILLCPMALAQNTDAVTQDRLIQRIDKLESKGKLAIFIGLMFGAGLFYMQFMKKPQEPNTIPERPQDVKPAEPEITNQPAIVNEPGVIRIQRLEIVDQTGRVCATLAAEGASPALKLFDKTGTLQVDISIDDDGIPGVGIFDSYGSERIWLMVDENDTPLINIYDKDAKVRLEMALDEGEGPRLNIYDNTGTARAELGMDDEKITKLVFWDRNETARISMITDEEDTPSLTLYHSDEQAYASLYLDNSGQAGISFVDSNGNAVWSMPDVNA